MKNIYLLPTDKPSRLYCWGQKLKLGGLTSANKRLGIINQHIYITSDGEIKEGDWVLYHEDRISQVLGINIDELKLDRGGVWNSSCERILLTTDPQLIKDGVQAIDNEFLEWFVKNPSCDDVELKPYCKKVTCKNDSCSACCQELKYKITIPTKLHSFCETPEENRTMNYCDENGCINRKRDLVSENLRLRDDAITDQKPPEKVYSKRDMLDFAWFLFKNIGAYSDDRLAHFEGEYLKSFEKIRNN